MTVVIDRSEQVSNSEIVDQLYFGQTFIAAGSRLDSIEFFLDGNGGSALAYRVLVTTATAAGDGFHPGAVLFESGTLSEAADSDLHKVVINTGKVVLTPGLQYAFIIDPVTDSDGQPSSAKIPLSFAAHGGPFGTDYADGYVVDYFASPGSTRADDFAANWNESDDFALSGRDLAFRLVFSNPGVTIDGTKGKDRIDATHAPDGEPKPTANDDIIFGNRGKDRLDGLGGDDRLDGGKSKDKLIGGDGEDSYVFSASLKQRPDKIIGFVAAHDTIVLSAKVFKTLDPGVLSDTAFRDVGEVGSAADRIVYKANGGLAYDKDGKGGADALVFAKLADAPDIDADDIVIA